jgi:Uma2 family endonuclease
MSSVDASKRPATVEDLLALPEDRHVELVNGELVDKAAPSPDHATAQAGLSGTLFGFQGPGGQGPRGPGGWWLMTEFDVYYEEHETYRHDLAGWRRERVPERPRERPIRLLPDWVCEVLSPTNAANDTVRKQRILHKHRVPHYWLLDPAEGTLRVLRWTEPGYLEVLGAKADETVRAEPFDALELSLSTVLGLE